MPQHSDKIDYFMYWQEIKKVGNPSNLGLIVEHITVLTEAQVISIYLHLGDN